MTNKFLFSVNIEMFLLFFHLHLAWCSSTVPHSKLVAGTNWGTTSLPFFLSIILSPIKRFGSWDELVDMGEGVEAEDDELEGDEEGLLESEGDVFEEPALCSRSSRRCLRVVASSRASVERVARRALVCPDEEIRSSW